VSEREEHVIDDGWAQGELLEVMESWPMQLLVRIGEEDVILEVSPEATITFGEAAGSARDLQPGRQVRVHLEHLKGYPSSRLTHEVEIHPAAEP